MDLKKLTERAKQLVDKRGGTESLKEDAEELRDIAGGRGSMTDKAKEAVEAIKDPGAARADEPVRDSSRGEGRGRHEPGERRGRQGRGHGEHRRER